MAEDIILDFSDAPPAQGAVYAHIPEGPYILKVDTINPGKTQDGHGTASVDFVVSRGPHKGKKVNDFFWFDKEKKFGIQRFHALIVACGVKQQAGKKGLSVFNVIVGRELVSDVADNVIPASDKYAERVGSRPATYYQVRSEEGKKRIAVLSSAADGATQAAPVAKAAAVPAAEDDPDDLGGDDLGEEPAAEAVASSSDDLDDLFE